MGSEPNRLIRALQSSPDSLAWSIPREVQVIRGPTGKLGLRFQTVQCFSKGVSNTVVLAVRGTCVVRCGELHKLDRIHKINGNSLANKSEDEVDAIFQNKSESVFNLEVQSEVSLKKDLNFDCVTETISQGQSVSAGSGSAVTMNGIGGHQMKEGSKPKRMLSHTSSAGKNSLCSIERPSAAAPNKRFMKSNSTEKDEGGQQMDSTSASMMMHPLAPSVDGYIPDMDRVSYNRVQSMPDPVSFAEIGIEIEEGERMQSLPTMNGTGRAIGTFHGCDNGVGTVKTLKPGLLSIRPCTNRNCLVEKEGCLWHSLIFKVPQFVVWEPMPKTVTLNRGKSDTFGINKKVKIQEATNDMYTLVESVVPGSVAEERGLHVGDWIRSINGEALQSRDEAYRTKFDQHTEIRLVIQRPEGIQQKAQSHIPKIKQKQKQKPLKLPQGRHPPSVNSPSSPAVYPTTPSYSNPLPRNILPSGSATSPSTVCQVSPISGSRVMWRGGYQEDSIDSYAVSPGMMPPGQDVMYARRYVSNVSPHSPDVRCVTCGKDTSNQISLPSSPRSPDDNCSPLYNLGRISPRSPKDGHTACVRVFVCGNSAPDLANLILSKSRAHQNVPLDSHVQMVKLSLKRYENSDIFVDLWQKRKCGSRDQFRVMNGTGYFNNSTCVQCVGDGTCVNVELFVIQDENFFHHCSHYLFTKESIFLIAFNAQKILTNMSSDITRLEQLIHTIRSHVGNSVKVNVYGILTLEPGEDYKDDEVRTMFYANDKKHGKYSVSIPQITFITRLNMPEATTDLCATLFSQAFSCDQKKSKAVECVCEVLSGLEHESRTVWNTEDIRQLTAVTYPLLKDVILQADVVFLLEQIGCIKCITGKVSELSPFSESSRQPEYFVHPITVLKRLECLCIDSKDSIEGEVMFTLSVTGLMPRSELAALLHNIVPDVDLYISCLQSLGIVYDIGQLDSGQDQAIFIPYFLEDVTCGGSPKTSDVCLLVVFDDAVPWTVFFRLVSELGRRPEFVKVKFSSLRSCVITLQNITLNLMFDKMKDCIVITVEKGVHPVKENVVLQMFQQLLSDTVPSYRHYIVGPPCPLREDHPHIPGHVIDLTSTPIMCVEMCLDNHSKIRRWLATDKQTNGQDYLSRNILKLPPGVFQSITDQLLINHDNDWTTLAGRLNKTSGDVEILRAKALYTGELPSKLLLIDWDHNKRGTIRQLIEHLTAMERYDVRDIITDYLNIRVDD